MFGLKKLMHVIAVFCFVAICAALSGCYLTPPTTSDPHDPLQSFNRDTNRMNTKLDEAIIKPVAKGYKNAVPYFIRRGVTNFFDNLSQPANVGNDLLQGHIRWALNDLWSFVINSTVGLGGFFNPAKDIDLQPHDNNFALTLNRYGIYTAYFVVPLMGPNTLGGVVAMPVDYQMGITQYFIPLRYSVILTLVEGLNTRTNLLSTEDTANGLIFDRYIFYRSAFLQRQQFLAQLNQSGPEYPSELQEDNDDQIEYDDTH